MIKQSMGFNDITENISGTDGDDMQSIGPLLGNIFGINKT